MKKITKKLTAWLLTGAMLVALIPAFSLTAFADVPTKLEIGGVDALTTASGEGWSYNPGTNTLILNGAVINTANSFEVGIYAEGDLNLIVAEDSENIIDLSGREGFPASCGILVEGELNIEGSGTLTITAANTVSETESLSCGIWADNLNITEAYVDVQSGNTMAVGNEAESAESTGIRVNYRLYAGEEAKVFSRTGTATVENNHPDDGNGKNSGAFCDGIKAGQGIDIDTGAKLSGMSDLSTAKGKGYAYSSGISSFGWFHLYGGEATAISGNAESDERDAYSAGLDIYDGNITLTDGTLQAIAGSASSNTGIADSTGVYLENSNFQLEGEHTILHAMGGEATSGNVSYSAGLNVLGGNAVIKDGAAAIMGGTYSSEEGDSSGIFVQAAKDEQGNSYGGKLTLSGGEITLSGESSAISAESGVDLAEHWYDWTSVPDGVPVNSWSQSIDPSMISDYTFLYLYPSTSFIDVAPDDWYYDAVDFISSSGMMSGVGNGKFDPNGITTRGQVVSILWRMDLEPVVNYAMTFEDVAAETWYTEAVRWAVSEEIVSGYSDTAFGPNDTITREQFASILYRYATYWGMAETTLEENLGGFLDGDTVSEYAISAMNWAVGQGLISGMESSDDSGMILAPKDGLTRAQIATILMKYIESL